MNTTVRRLAPYAMVATLSVAASFSAYAVEPDKTSSSAASQIITRDTFRTLAKRVTPAITHIKIKSNIVLTQGGGRGKLSLPPGMDIPEDMQNALERMLEREAPNMSPGDRDDLKYARSGSGVLVSSDGYIVTSNHVIAKVRPEDIEVNLPDNRTFSDVKVVGVDELTDLAVLKVDGKDLPCLTWGDSDSLDVGDHVMAIGNPLEFNNSVSEGIVSAKHRTIKKAPIEDLIQTTAMINPGNSGGALVDLDGSLVGINMAIASSTGMWSGLGFAIPSRTAKQVTDQIINRGKVNRGYLGIDMEELTDGLANQLGYKDGSGIVVKDVRPGSAAEKAGVERYDIVAKVDGKPIKDRIDMVRTVGGRNSGESIELEIWRDTGTNKLDKKVVKVKLDERPNLDDLDKGRGPKLPGKPTVRTDSTLGMTFKKEDAADADGLLVQEVKPGSRAAMADIRPGDRLIEVNKKRVKSEQDVQQAVTAQQGGGHMLYVDRDGDRKLITVPTEAK